MGTAIATDLTAASAGSANRAFPRARKKLTTEDTENTETRHRINSVNPCVLCG